MLQGSRFLCLLSMWKRAHLAGPWLAVLALLSALRWAGTGALREDAALAWAADAGVNACATDLTLILAQQLMSPGAKNMLYSVHSTCTYSI